MKTRLFLICLALFVSSSGCHKPAPVAWKPFAPAGGRFTVLVPSEPKLETQKAPDGSESKVYRLYPFLSNVRAMAVGYADQPASATAGRGAEQILNESRDVSLTDLKGKLLSESSLALQGYPGRELKIAIPNNHKIRMRIFLAGPRKYSLMVVANGDNIDSPDALKFLDSFQITR